MKHYNIFFMVLIMSTAIYSCKKDINSSLKGRTKANLDLGVFHFNLDSNTNSNYFAEVYNGIISKNKILILNNDDTVTFIEHIIDIGSTIQLENRDILSVKTGTNNSALCFNKNEISVISNYNGSSVNITIYKEQKRKRALNKESGTQSTNTSGLMTFENDKIIYDIRKMYAQKKSNTSVYLCGVNDLMNKRAESESVNVVAVDITTPVNYNIYIFRRKSTHGTVTHDPIWETSRILESAIKVVPGIVFHVIDAGIYDIGNEQDFYKTLSIFKSALKANPVFGKRITEKRRDIYLLAQTFDYNYIAGIANVGKGFGVFRTGFDFSNDYNVAAHEVGHIFSALHHTELFWNGSWYADLMTTRPPYAITNVHKYPSNIEKFKNMHGRYTVQYMEP